MSNFLYYSKITKEPYETLEELDAAEDAVRAAEKEQAEKDKLKQSKAAEIDAAIKELNEKKEAVEKMIADYNKEFGPMRLVFEKEKRLSFPFCFPFFLF